MQTVVPSERESHVRFALQQLQLNRSVLLFGDPGTGKTHLGLTVALRAAVQGNSVGRIRPPGGGRQLLFGQIRSTDPGVAKLTEADSTEIERRLLEGAGHQPVVYVDDAHLLGADDAEWLCGLVYGSKVSLVAAVNAQDDRSAAVERFTRLWVDDIAARIDLKPLDRRQSLEMIRALRGSILFDLATELAIVRASGGLPGLIRELVNEIIEGGVIAGVNGSFVYPLQPVPSQRVQDMVWHGLGSLSDAQQDALVLLSRLEGIPQERAARYVGDSVLRDLIRSGHLAMRKDSGAIAVTNGVAAESILAMRRSERQLDSLKRAAKLMLHDHLAGIALRPLEYLFLGEHSIEDPAFAEAATESERAEIYLIAAAKSLAMGSLYAAMTFGKASFAESPTIEASVELSRIFTAMGNYKAAVAALDQLDVTDATAYSLVVASAWLGKLQTWLTGTDEAALATEILNRILGALPAQQAVVVETGLRSLSQLVAAQWEQSVETALRVIDQPSPAEELLPIRILSTDVLYADLTQLGDGAAFRSALESGRALQSFGGRSRSVSAGILEERAHFILLSSRLVATISIGVDVAAVPDELEAAMDDALTQGEATRAALLGAVVGFNAMCRGNFDLAELELRLASARVHGALDSRWPDWIAGVYSWILLQLGRLDEARDVINELAGQHYGATEHRNLVVALQSAELHRLDRKERDEQPTELVAFADSMADRSISSQLSTLFLAVSDGADAAAHVDTVADLREATDLPVLHGMADFIIGMANRDPVLLDGASQLLADAGHLAFARIASSRASEMHSVLGRRVAAAASQAFAQQLHLGMASRTGYSDDATPELVALTTREKEIVYLVSRGFSNKQIAADLFVSVRTVESHFYQARVKLGAVSRSEIIRLAREVVVEDGKTMIPGR
ncbi:LuxR C-terminal-related transcriptional regulator [soil metagenome]